MTPKVFRKTILFSVLYLYSCNIFRSSEPNICLIFRDDVEKNWRRVEGMIYWDPTVTFVKNDELIKKLEGKYSLCLIGMHRDSVISLFGQTTQVSPNSIVYLCVPPESRNEKDIVYVRFHLKDDKTTRLSISNRGVRID